MTTTEQRQILLPLIEQAVQDGARLRRACTQIGLSARTVQRWHQPCALAGDCRVGALRAKVAPPGSLRDRALESVLQPLFVRRPGG